MNLQAQRVSYGLPTPKSGIETRRTNYEEMLALEEENELEFLNKEFEYKK